MKRIHPSTSLAVVLNLTAVALYSQGFHVAAMILPVVGFFGALREISIYTSWYQFVMVTVSALLVGVFVDLSAAGAPLMTFAMFVAAMACVMRIMFFNFFFYTGYRWLEPLLFSLCMVLYVSANLTNAYGWTGIFIPAPLVLFAAVFTWGTIKDKNQLLTQSRGGYKVQVGKPADNFELPDQDGNLIKLSDYKTHRHVLLIFVRGDWCPGCHMMLRTYEKNNEKFKSKNILIVAVGPDPVGVNRGMVEKLGLEFKVLSDEGQKTAMTYGVQLKEYDNNFAEKYEEGIPLPASFLIDKEGIVRYVSRPDKVGEFLNPSLIFPIVEQLN